MIQNLHLKKSIEELIAIGNTKEAIKLLMKNSKGELRKRAIIISNRFHEIKNNNINGLITFQEQKIEIRKINQIILEILDKDESTFVNQITSKRPNSNWAQIILAICAILSLFLSIYLLASS